MHRAPAEGLVLVQATVFLAFIDRVGSAVRSRRLGVCAACALLLVLTVSPCSIADEARTALHWKPFSAQTYDAARASGRPFVIEFAAEWCRPCKEMQQRTFTDSKVLEAGEGTTFLSVDMTTSDRIVELILKSFAVVGAPTTIFYGPDGKEWKRKIGFIGPADFAEYLRQGWKKGDSGKDNAVRGV